MARSSWPCSGTPRTPRPTTAPSSACSTRWSSARRDDPRSELVLRDLAARIAGHDVDDLDAFRDLLRHQSHALAVLAHVEDRRRLAELLRNEERDDHLAPFLVGDAEHRDVGYFRVAVENVLDLLGRDVLTLADDDVLDAAGDEDRAVLVEAPEVTGAQEPVVGERVAVERAVDVA